MPGTVRVCNNCHGHGTVQKEVKPGVWKEITCPGCGGTGKVDLRTV